MASAGPPGSGGTIYSVADLVSEMRNLLERSYRNVQVEGEISNLATPASGHLYFSLKERDALIRCAFFRNRRRGTAVPEEGMQVVVRGQISIYPGRGDLQLIVSHLEPAGEGALRRAFEALKKKLDAEGLFDSARKQALPPRPGRIGIVSSATGAALQDILITLKRRYPIARVILYPALVQGPEAPSSLCRMLALASERREVDVVLIARGGGSLEDLQAFNDEAVARAIADCPLPTVSGVGHETDFSITDLVADQRGATPTAAASLITPDLSETLASLRVSRTRLLRLTEQRLQHLGQRLDHATSRLTHPARYLARLDELRIRRSRDLIRSAVLGIARRRHRLERLGDGVQRQSPTHLLARYRARVIDQRRRINRQINYTLSAVGQQIAHRRGTLQLVNPAHTLKRGYAILQNPMGQVITSQQNVDPGEVLDATVADGKFQVTVNTATSNNDPTKQK